MTLQILFENAAFVAVDKPHGVLTTPSRMGLEDPRPCLGRDLQAQLQRQIFPVHRLDEEVSGIVLFALTAEAHKEGQKWFEERAVQKFYRAQTAAAADPPSAELQIWKSRLLRGKKRAYESPHGQESITHAYWNSNAQGSHAWNWILQPITGRAHQLRFECAKHGVPILGDVLYGGREISRPGIALRHFKLQFPSEVQNRWLLPEKLELKTWDQSDFASWQS